MRALPLSFAALALLPLTGCMRKVVLEAEPEAVAATRLPLTARVEAGRVTAESNQANPISFDFPAALAAYAERRGTFERVVDGPADVDLKVTADFRFSSGTRFLYAFKLVGTLTAAGRPIGRYEADGSAEGGMTRFTAAADVAPTNKALNAALDKLFLRIEADRDMILERAGRAPAVAAAPAAPAPAAPAFSSDVDRPRYKLGERPDDYALVIGVEKYQNIPPAEFAGRDAEAVRRHLLALGYPERNVITLVGPQAGRTGIEKYLKTWLPLNVKPDSRVFVYFSGHGAPDPASAQAYLVPWDGDPKFLADTAIPLKRFYADLSALKASRVLVAMDACFSGAGGRSVLAKGARPLVSKVDTAVASGQSLVVLAAAGADEITGTAESEGHGLFTYELLKALEESGGKGSAADVFARLKPKVQDAARRDGREQTPLLMAGSAAGSDAPLR